MVNWYETFKAHYRKTACGQWNWHASLKLNLEQRFRTLKPRYYENFITNQTISCCAKRIST